MKILVAGGAGYIGSHTSVLLLENGHKIVVADSLINSSMDAVAGVKKITGREFPFYNVDFCDLAATEKVFEENNFDGIIHFAGLKAVGESVIKPVFYYENNLTSTLNLCKCMKKFNVPSIIFSSSATVYRGDNPMPLTEESALGASNPYGWTKFMCEQILKDAAAASGGEFSVVLLRYFNPVGAHPSGIIGEEPDGIPNNLMPFVAQTARGIHAEVKVFGNDYDTSDGTGVRDYIHVMDLSDAHIKALDFAAKNKGCEAFNIGTGTGYSVLEMINAFGTVNELNVPYSIAPRRAGDIATCYANPQKAATVLGFKAEKNLEDMCQDTWAFQKQRGV